MYSDVIEIDKIPPKQNVEYYRKVQKTTSRTVYEDGKKPQHKEETKTYVERSNNLNQKSGQFVPTSNYRNNISGSKYNNSLNQKNQTNSKNYSSNSQSYTFNSKQYDTSNKNQIQKIIHIFQPEQIILEIEVKEVIMKVVHIIKKNFLLQEH